MMGMGNKETRERIKEGRSEEGREKGVKGERGARPLGRERRKNGK